MVVEPTMSVNSTVARARLDGAAGRTPVTNSSMCEVIASVTVVGKVVCSGQLDVRRSWDHPTQVSALLDIDDHVSDAMHHERRNAHVLQHRPHIDGAVHSVRSTVCQPTPSGVGRLSEHVPLRWRELLDGESPARRC